jgi:hypothetical protein
MKRNFIHIFIIFIFLTGLLVVSVPTGIPESFWKTQNGETNRVLKYQSIQEEISPHQREEPPNGAFRLGIGERHNRLSDQFIPDGSEVNMQTSTSRPYQDFTLMTTPQSKGFEVRKVTNIFEFRAGVIVNSNQSTVYLMNLQRGIDAIDLSSGKLLWSTTKAAKPLLLHGDRLVAQAESAASSNLLRIVVLNTQDAGELLFEATVQLPEDVQVAIDDGLGTTFRTTARLHENNVIVSWQFSKQHISGAPRGPDAKVRVATGAVRIDLETGNTNSLQSEQVLPTPDIRLPDTVVRLVTLGTLPGTQWQVANVVAAIIRTSGEGGERTVLRRWHSETGQPLPEVVLFGGELTYRYISADGRHLLASRPLDSSRAVWVWHLYSLETGDHVAQVRNASPAAWFFITASSLVHEAPPTARIINGRSVLDQPLRLRAIDLKTSDELWEWPFRDTTYRGPYPPM